MRSAPPSRRIAALEAEIEQLQAEIKALKRELAGRPAVTKNPVNRSWGRGVAIASCGETERRQTTHEVRGVTATARPRESAYWLLRIESDLFVLPGIMPFARIGIKLEPRITLP